MYSVALCLLSRHTHTRGHTQEWLPAARGKGMEVVGTFVRRGGQIYADMTFNNKAMDIMSTFAIQFNKNRYYTRVTYSTILDCCMMLLLL